MNEPDPTARPARGLAVLGDLAGTGITIKCEAIAPIMVHGGKVYEYSGTSDGIAIYHPVGLVQALEQEQADRQITGGDQ